MERRRMIPSEGRRMSDEDHRWGRSHDRLPDVETGCVTRSGDSNSRGPTPKVHGESGRPPRSHLSWLGMMTIPRLRGQLVWA